ncbi:hypothetical protein BGW39_009747 [Mortierella sp. 14UC]|nr:hypothetical protein BGW39_009747 [Mortierella sp. 14UC]
MSGPIQNGRYKIWRSPKQHQLIVTLNGPNSMAVLGRPEELDNPENPETGIWIVTATSPPSPNSVNLASADAISAIVQHEATKAFLAIDDPANPGRGANIYVKSEDRQVWTLSPASTTGDGGEEGEGKNEFHIGYPDLVDGQVLVVDNSFSRAFPPRLALQPLGTDMTQVGLPWRFEPIA